MKSLRYRQTVAPTERPISLGDLKRYSVIEHNDDDALWLTLIDAATAYAENDTGLQLCSATYEVYFDAFSDCMELPVQPVIGVDEITYFDSDAVEQTLDTAVYGVDTLGIAPAVVPAAGQSWPAVEDRINAVKITFTAGHASAAAVPHSVKMALLMLCRSYDENREGVAFTNVSEIPHAVTALLSKHRVYPSD